MRPCRSVAAAGAALALLGAAGCGGDDPGGALEETAAKLAEIRSGTLDVRLGLVPSGSAGVSIALKGPVALSGERSLPVADVDYAQQAGRTTEATFTSTGEEAFVTTGGTTVELEGRQLEGLRVGDGDTTSLADLGLDVERWIDEPSSASGERVDGQATERITGKLNAAEALGDLAAVAGQAGGLAEADVDRLSRTVSRSSIEVVTGKEDRLLRGIALDVALDVPPELRARTGGTTELRITLDVTLREVNEPVRVEAPAR